MLADVSSYIDIGALLKILLIGLVAGAGLTAVFSIGIEGLSRGGYASEAEEGASTTRNPAALVLAVVCFMVVLAGIGYGISVALTK
jgi:hypothetical protein